MTTRRADYSPYLLPKEPGRWRAITLALVVHIALLVFLWIGVNWQSQVPVAIEAEVWDRDTKEAAPLAPAPRPVPAPAVHQEPAEPHLEPEHIIKELPAASPKVEQPTLPDPEIALAKERERKHKELEQQKHDEQERKRIENERQRKAQEDERLAQQEQAQRDRAIEKAEKQKAEAEAKEKAAAEAKQKAEADARQKQKLEAAKKADAAAAEARHNQDMKRLIEQASGNNANNSTGTAEKSQSPHRADSGYAARVGAKIRGNINFNVPESLAGNPAAEFNVQLLPDGSVASVSLRKSSGVPGFDEAVRRAIERSAPYPKDKSGSVPSSFLGIHRPKDQ